MRRIESGEFSQRFFEIKRVTPNSADEIFPPFLAHLTAIDGTHCEPGAAMKVIVSGKAGDCQAHESFAGRDFDVLSIAFGINDKFHIRRGFLLPEVNQHMHKGEQDS